MSDNLNDPFAANLIGLWDFLDGGETEDTGLADSIAQDGHLEGGADISGGQLHTDGWHDYFDVETSGNSDDAFDLTEGTVAVQFTQEDRGWSSPDVLVNRGEYDDRHDEGWFGLSVTHDGKVTVDHVDNGQSAHLSTEAQFFNEHDKVKATYSWSETDGLTLHVQNLTQDTETTITSSQTGLTMDVTDKDDESWTFAAREEDDGDYDQFFKGKIDYVAVYNKDIINSGPDGAVDGEETGEVMELDYDDSNSPTDGGGDIITNDADLIFGNGGDDTIDGAGGNDTIHGDSPDAGAFTGPRESFNWEQVSGAEADSTVTQDSGSVSVTYTRIVDTGHHKSDIDNSTTLNTDGIDGGGETVDPDSSLYSETGGHGNTGAFRWDFSEAVGNLEFNINDLDGDGLVTVSAFDAEGNPVKVALSGGSDITVTGNVADAGPYQHPDDPDTTVQVSIEGPVSRVEVEHTQDGGNNSGIFFTDMYFDTGFVLGAEGGNDEISGGDGDDLIFGNGGNDSIEGGAGDDRIFGDNGAPVGGPDNNLIANGSFEDTSGMTETGYGYVSTGSIPGWTTDDSSAEIDVHDDERDGMVQTDGENWLDLEASPGNIRIGQDVQGVVDGAEYQLNFDVSDSQYLTSSDGPDENTVKVYWGGELIDTIDPSNVDESDFETVTLTLTGGAGDGSNRLEFEGTGQEDNLGAAIDNVQLFALDPAVGNSGEGGDDTIIGGEGADTMVGEGGDDTFIISNSADADGDVVIGGNGPDDATDEDVLDLRGTGQVTIVDADDASDDGGRAGTVTFADGSTLEFSQIETILTDPQNDGIVDGGDDGEPMGLGYTDPQGDEITTGDDSIRGNDGDDTIDGDAGNDTIDGGVGNDEITGGAGNDSVDGGDGADTLAGGDGTDTLNGGAGDDDIAVGGSDSATGGTGDDVFTIDPTDSAADINVTIDGGSDGTDGNPDGDENGDEGDIIDLSDRPEDLTVVLEDADPESGTVNGLDADNAPDVTFDEIEKIITGSGEDMIDADDADGPINVETGPGDDSVEGGNGDDLISTGPGNDTINSGNGSDTVDAGEGNNLIDTSGDGIPLLDDKNGDGSGFASYGPVLAAPADHDENDDRDLVVTGSGRDTIFTGDDDDTINAAGGDNLIDAGIDDDDITTGDGSDTIVGGEGSDTVNSGDGDDLIFGGLNPADGTFDELNIPDAPDGGSSGPDPDEDNGRDLIYAGAGNDTVYGQDDDDTIYGGDGDDVLDGGVDDDLIEGGNGDDKITGGQGADTLFGEAGSDTFIIENREDAFGDVIDGGTEDGDGDPTTDNENDQLDLTGLGRFEIVQNDGSSPLVLTSPNDADGNSFTGQVNFLANDGSVEGTLEFTEIEDVIPCFTPGTVIATPKGERLVEELGVGDRIITRDNGLQQIRWVGRRDLSRQELMSAPHLKPVLIRAGSLGHGLPEQDMMVSPQHRVLINNERSALYFDDREVLAAAKHLTGIEGVDPVETRGVSYIHFMFDQHEVVLSNGAWTESFQPGEQVLDGMGNAQKVEIFDLFPELQKAEGIKAYQTARRSLKQHEARLLVN